MKTVLLTGASGFLGSHLLVALLEEGYSVVILKRSTSDTWRIKHLLHQVSSYDIDVQPISLAFEQQSIDAVIHTACKYGRNGESFSEIADSNLMFALKVLDESLAHGTGVFVNTDTFFNSGDVVQKHLSAYTLCKKQFVEWLGLQVDKIQVINLKLQHIYGPRDDSGKFVPWLAAQLESDVPRIRLTKGEQLRDFVYVDDVVSAFLIVLQKSKQLDRFSSLDVGTGKLTSVRELVESMKKINELYCVQNKSILDFGSIPYGDGEVMSVKVNTCVLNSLGWMSKVSIHDGINKLFAAKDALSKR